MVSLTVDSSMKNLDTQDSYQSQPTGSWNGRRIFLFDSSYQQKDHFKAGVGPNMFDGLFEGIGIGFCLMTATVATLSVAIATQAWKPILITAGITYGISMLFALAITRKT